MWTLFQIVLGVTMVVTGSINTLSVKWANKLESENKNGTEVLFNHPYLQSSFMFLGEVLCLGAFFVTLLWSKHRPSIPDPEPTKKQDEEEPVGPYSPFILLPPALCDVTATSIMYVALTLTSASSFQMLRGSILIFVGILSVLVLRRRLEWFRWLGMFIILVGLIVVGVSDFLQAEEKKESSSEGGSSSNSSSTGGEDEGVSDEILGDALVVAAQVRDPSNEAIF